MRNKTVILECIEDPCTGELGLILEKSKSSLYSIESCDPITGDGILIAHDLMEHVGGIENIGGIGEEIEALGAVWFVRGWTGTLREGRQVYHSPEVDLASDLSRFFINGYGFGKLTPKTSTGRDDDNFDEIIKEIISETRNQINAELEYQDDLPSAWTINEYLQDAVHFLRTGYRKARTKYKREERWGVYNQFQNIAKEIDNNIYTEFEGQQWTLTYGEGSAFVDEYYQEEY